MLDQVETVPLSYFIDELMLLDEWSKLMAEDYIRKVAIDSVLRLGLFRTHRRD